MLMFSFDSKKQCGLPILQVDLGPNCKGFPQDRFLEVELTGALQIVKLLYKKAPFKLSSVCHARFGTWGLIYAKHYH